jgi:hypothetical protein
MRLIYLSTPELCTGLHELFWERRELAVVKWRLLKIAL